MAKDDLKNKKWKPSNGSIGSSFMCAFCNKCIHDDVDFGGRDGCDILARTLIHNITDPDYPSEWTYDDEGDPVCTAFKPVGGSCTKAVSDRCTKTVDMFEEKQ